MGGVYAWLVMTLAIFLIAATLSGIQRSQAAGSLDSHDTATTTSLRTQ
jgi:hypothetical protein